MASFNQSTARILITGAVFLGTGIYYQFTVAQRVEDARMALLKVDAANVQVETARASAEKYLRILEIIVHENMDRQEPFSVVSEFTPQEIKEVGPLLDTLYQRDGHFFLEHFKISWRTDPEQRDRLPRVVLELEGRKVLLFSHDAADINSLAVVDR